MYKTSILLLLLTTFTLGAQDDPKKDALLLYRQGDFKAAIEVCKTEITARPDNMDSYTVLGWSLLRLKDYAQAIKYAEEALAKNKFDWRINEIAGEANYYLGKSKEALKYFEQYAVLAPTGDRIELVYYFMGEIYLQLGDYNRADIALTTAIYHAPSTAKWWERLGFARLQAKDYKNSKTAYDEALRLNPNSPEAQRGRKQAEEKLATPN